jgi:hypothetical protein
MGSGDSWLPSRRGRRAGLLVAALVLVGCGADDEHKAGQLNPHPDLPTLPDDPRSKSVARGAQGGSADSSSLRPAARKEPARLPAGALKPQRRPLPDVLGEGGAGAEE